MLFLNHVWYSWNEIPTLVTNLTHQDSMGNTANIGPREVQRMTAGSGVVHSEWNKDKTQGAHLFQIWVKPRAKGLPPGYDQRNFAEAIHSGEPVLVVSQDGRENSLSIHQDLDLTIMRFKESKSHSFSIKPNRAAWVQVVTGKIKVNGDEIQTGDAISAEDEPTLTISGEAGAEFLLFDLEIV